MPLRRKAYIAANAAPITTALCMPSAVTGKNSEALWALLRSTACPVWLDGDLLEGNACLQELYQDKDIAARLLPLSRDGASCVRQRR